MTGIGIRFTEPGRYRLRETIESEWTGPMRFRAIVHYLASGLRDPHRSRYWVNGRVVRHGQYQRARRRAWRPA